MSRLPQSHHFYSGDNYEHQDRGMAGYPGIFPEHASFIPSNQPVHRPPGLPGSQIRGPPSMPFGRANWNEFSSAPNEFSRPNTGHIRGVSNAGTFGSHSRTQSNSSVARPGSPALTDISSTISDTPIPNDYEEVTEHEPRLARSGTPYDDYKPQPWSYQSFISEPFSSNSRGFPGMNQLPSRNMPQPPLGSSSLPSDVPMLWRYIQSLEQRMDMFQSQLLERLDNFTRASRGVGASPFSLSSNYPSRASSLAPSDSLSNVGPVTAPAPSPKYPSPFPFQVLLAAYGRRITFNESDQDLPESFSPNILWTYEYARSCGEIAGFSTQNPNRPELIKAIRNLQGGPISKEMLSAMKNQARSLALTILALHQTVTDKTVDEVLPTPTLMGMYAEYFRGAEVLLSEEYQEIAACFGYWKARILLFAAFSRLRGNALRVMARKAAAASSSTPSEAAAQPQPSSKKPAAAREANNRPKATRTLTSHLQLEPSIASTPKRADRKRGAHFTPEPPKRSRGIASSSASETHSISDHSARALLSPSTPPPSSDGEYIPINHIVSETESTDSESSYQSHGSYADANTTIRPVTCSLPQMPNSPMVGIEPAGPLPPPLSVDLRGLQTKPTFASIQKSLNGNELTGLDPSTRKQALELISSLQTHPCFSTPSDTVLLLLEHLQLRDPEGMADDDLAEGWGHYQYTKGSTTIASSIRSWADIGSTNVACELLAAGITICKGARLMCHQLGLKPTPSFISDTYLGILSTAIAKAWNETEHMKGKSATSSEPLSPASKSKSKSKDNNGTPRKKKSPPSHPSPREEALRAQLSKLTAAELRTLCTHKKIPVSNSLQKGPCINKLLKEKSQWPTESKILNATPVVAPTLQPTKTPQRSTKTSSKATRTARVPTPAAPSSLSDPVDSSDDLPDTVL